MINKLFNVMAENTDSANVAVNLSGSTPEMMFIISLGFTLLISLLMAVTYRLSHNALSYNRKFNIALVMLAFISTVLLDLVQSNPLFSLGVLGSLSICRIRMNTKDPRDLGFVFWALSIGIASATGAYFAGTMCAVVLFILLTVTGKRLKRSNSCMVVVRGENPQIESVQKVFHQIHGVSVQSKNIFEDTFELVYELHVKEKEEERLLKRLNTLEGIHGVNILAPETQAA